ncbi:MAG: hypothetical protein RL205_679 [Actinomycetota bacterium]
MITPKKLSIALALGVVVATIAPAAAHAVPIPDGHGKAVSKPFYGHAAKAKPVPLSPIPQNPFMSANGTSNIHNDSYMSDTYTWAGPLGKNTQVSSAFTRGECASITFNSKGQIVGICILKHAYLTLLEPKSLRILSQVALPEVAAASGTGSNDYTEIAGGYFYLDNLDRAVVSTATRHLITYEVTKNGAKSTFTPVAGLDFDLSPYIAADDTIQSALPDFNGNIWFITGAGVVGAVNPKTGVIKSTTLNGERIGNSFSMDKDGSVYIVSTAAMYRFSLSADGTPQVDWRSAYQNTGIQKPGQKSIGSGTTPTIMDGGRVAIADNANPINVVVYNTDPKAATRVVCEQPVFKANASATENSLIAVGNTLIVENNYGNATLKSTLGGKTSLPGMARVDIAADGICSTAWTNTSVIAPSVVPKFSAATGLIYTYTKPKGPGKVDRWYWTALDYRTGKLVYSTFVGNGLMFNNNYASAYVGPDGSGYVGVTGGLVRIYDQP